MSTTKQRSLILDVIDKSYNHLTAYEVYEECLKTLPNISLGTVYRNLNVLVETGKIKRIKMPNNVDRFDHILDNNEHAHFVCIKCNKIKDVFEKVNIPEYIDDNKVLDYELTFKGICKECQKEGEN